MRELPEKINFDDVWNLYEGRRPTDVKQPEIEKLTFDREVVQVRMNRASCEIFKIKMSESEQDVPYRTMAAWREVIDDAIPLIFIAKKEKEKLSFDIVKNQTKEGFVSGIEFVLDGDSFSLVDRFTKAKFRGQGFGSMLLRAYESYIQESATEKQEITYSVVDAAQLDVICWLYNNGYRPRNDEDAKRLSEILSGDNEIIIGDKNYFFKSVPKQDQEDFHNAYRIKFVKEFSPKVPTAIANLQEETRISVKDN